MCLLFNFWCGHLSFALFPRSRERANQTIRELFSIILTTYSNMPKKWNSQLRKNMLQHKLIFLTHFVFFYLVALYIDKYFARNKTWIRGVLQSLDFEWLKQKFNENNLNWEYLDMQQYESSMTTMSNMYLLNWVYIFPVFSEYVFLDTDF